MQFLLKPMQLVVKSQEFFGFQKFCIDFKLFNSFPFEINAVPFEIKSIHAAANIDSHTAANNQYNYWFQKELH